MSAFQLWTSDGDTLLTRGDSSRPRTASGVTVSGSYAYVADLTSGLHVVDVADPTSPVIVGSIDNLLRPRLVGRDTKMHDLLILFSTLGGIVLFGVAGFIIGPIIAALFVTVWDIYGTVFKSVLPAVTSIPPDAD